mmetsp:Transcript_4556/g.13108  ORF Transcript_4556/g.13108 Transcript_4556/m.13108 type:complete len:176 (-) Transcript_4556:717-1244(-)
MLGYRWRNSIRCGYHLAKEARDFSTDAAQEGIQINALIKLHLFLLTIALEDVRQIQDGSRVAAIHLQNSKTKYRPIGGKIRKKTGRNVRNAFVLAAGRWMQFQYQQQMTTNKGRILARTNETRWTPSGKSSIKILYKSSSRIIPLSWKSSGTNASSKPSSSSPQSSSRSLVPWPE